MTQQEAWDELLKAEKGLVKLSRDIQDFAVEEAIETITKSLDNYFNREGGD